MPPRPRPIRDRLLEKVIITDSCWLWTGAVLPTGYGRIGDVAPRRVKFAHRVAYEVFVGQIPDGLVIDHLCRVRHCVNPLHLEAVTNAENIRRVPRHLTGNGRKTHCPQGHPYDEANTIIDQGKRRCRECEHARAVQRWATRRKAA